MAIYPLPKEGLSAGRGKKLAVISASITGTGAITTGLTTVDYAVPCCVSSATTIPSEVATISSISAGTVNAVVIAQQAAANAISSSAETVTVFAVGN